MSWPIDRLLNPRQKLENPVTRTVKIKPAVKKTEKSGVIIRKVWNPTPNTSSLVVTLPRRETKFLQKGDSVQITVNEKTEEVILRKVKEGK